MSKVIGFSHPPKIGHWSKVLMTSGEPCWISIAKEGILIKKSKIGLFGKTVFKKGPIEEIYSKLGLLDKKFNKDLCPEDMKSFILKSFTNAALNCKNLDELESVLKEIYQ